jgi:iodotyrosine deiodinase
MQAYEAVPLPDRSDYSDAEMVARARSFYEEIRRRHTVRDYVAKPVPQEVIEACLLAAGAAPSGANQQPWHFSVVSDPEIRRQIRIAAEAEEQQFYAGKAGTEWLEALHPIGTDSQKPFLEIAPWLIVIWGSRKSPDAQGRMRKNYYVPESVGIATGFLIAALHHAGLATLTHTPNPMGFLNKILNRPEQDKAYIMLVVGHPATDATIPMHATQKKSLEEISTWI